MTTNGKRAVRTAVLAAIYPIPSARAFEGSKLPATTKDLESIPEAARDLYEKVGDDFVLATDDSGFKKRLAEFRNTNIELMKKMEDQEARLKQFEGIDPKKVLDMQKKLEEMEDQTLLDEGKLDELLQARTDRLRKDLESQRNKIAEERDKAVSERDKYRGRLETTLIDSQISNAVASVGTVRKGALPDVLSRARSLWKLDDEGNPIAQNPDGSKRFGGDGSKALSMEEWAKDLLLDAPFLFEGSTGGGSNNRDGSNRNTGPSGAVSASDRRAFSQNLEKIAAGEVQVVGGR